jgi:hypothetical protein
MMKWISLFALFTSVVAVADPMPPAGLQASSTPTIELLTNGGFEASRSAWTTSGPSGYTFTVSSSSPLNGKASAIFTSSAANQILSSSQYSIKEGLKGGNCSASVLYKTTEVSNLYNLRVVDGSSNVLGSNTLVGNAGGLTSKKAVTFICPSSGTVAVQVISAGSASSIKLDDFTLGKNETIEVSQATLYGTAHYDPGCTLSKNTGSVTLGSGYAFVSYGGNPCSATLTGGISSADYSSDSITLNNLPPGNYRVVYQQGFRNDVNSNLSFVGLTDGTVQGGAGFVGQPTTSGSYVYSSGAIEGMFKYSTGQSNVTIFPFASVSSAIVLNNYDLPGDIYVYRYPTQSETAVKPETQNWSLDATVVGTGTIPYTTTGDDIAVGTFFDQASDLVLTNRVQGGNTQTVQGMIPCAGGESPSGSSCVTNNETLGVAFNPLSTGKVNVCADFASSIGTGGGDVNQFFRLEHYNGPLTVQKAVMETAATVHQAGTNPRALDTPFHICSTFNITEMSTQSFLLTYGTTVGQSIGSQALEMDGYKGRNVHFTVRPVTQNVPAPVLVNSVISPYAGAMRIIEAGYALCTSSPCTLGSNGGFSSMTRTSTGVYVLNFANAFSIAPTCVYSGQGSADSYGLLSATTTYLALATRNPTTAASQDSDGYVICLGPN